MKTSFRKRPDGKWWLTPYIPIDNIRGSISPLQLLAIRHLAHKAYLKGRKDERKRIMDLTEGGEYPLNPSN